QPPRTGRPLPQAPDLEALFGGRGTAGAVHGAGPAFAVRGLRGGEHRLPLGGDIRDLVVSAHVPETVQAGCPWRLAGRSGRRVDGGLACVWVGPEFAATWGVAVHEPSAVVCGCRRLRVGGAGSLAGAAAAGPGSSGGADPGTAGGAGKGILAGARHVG